MDTVTPAPAPPGNLQTGRVRFRLRSLKDTFPPPEFLNILGWEAPGTRSMPPDPAYLGRQEGGPREAWRARNPQASSRCGEGVRAEEGMAFHAEPAILGDVRLGIGSLGTRSWQGLGQGPKGQGRARSPWRGGTGSGTGSRPQSRCWVPPELPALHPAHPWARPRGKGGPRPQYGLRPESEQRTARAGSLQSRRPRGRQPLPPFLCLWHCPGVRIYSRFSQE